MKEKLTLILRNLVASVRRFPLCILLALIFGICQVLTIEYDCSYSPMQCFMMLHYPAIAFLLQLLFYLGQEEYSWGKKGYIALGIAHVVVFVGLLFWATSSPYTVVSRLAQLAVYLLLMAGILLISFPKEKTDLPLWHLLVRGFNGVAIGLGSSLLLGLALIALFKAVEIFFSIHLFENREIRTMIFCLSFVWPVITLYFIPKHEEMHKDAADGLPKLINGILHWLGVPLIVAYLVVLYAYGCKILIEWELPKGTVTWMTAILMALMLLLVIAFFPSHDKAEKRFDQFLLRWLPVAVLPLLVLMSVAIGRRISDYGITISRLYVVLFNLWCYGVCIGLIVTRCSRIRGIIASFVGLFALASIGPQGFPSLTYAILKSEVKAIVTADKVTTLPISYANMKRILDQKGDHSQLIDKLYYLLHTYEERSYDLVFGDLTARLIKQYHYTSDRDGPAQLNMDVYFSAYPQELDFTHGRDGMSHQDAALYQAKSIPADCKLAQFNQRIDTERRGDAIVGELHVSEGDHEKLIPFSLSYKKILHLDESSSNALYRIDKNGVTFIFRTISYTYKTQELAISGYVIY